MSGRAKVAVALLAVLGIGLLIAGFLARPTAEKPAPAPAATPTVQAVPSTAPATPLRPSPTGDLDMDWPTAASDESSFAAPIATRAMTAFLRPGSASAQQQWWTTLRPLLSQGAQSDYAATDPARVWATRVTGAPAQILPDVAAQAMAGDSGSDNLEGDILMGVPTDAGVYGVWVITEGPERGKVARISPIQD